MKVTLALACVLAAVSLSSAGRLISTSDLTLPVLGDAPDFCHGLECPPFKLLKNTSNYQLRQYQGAKFVGTNIEGSNFEVAVTKAFTKLFRYISGNNVDNKKISMTTPVITFVKPNDDFTSSEKNYTVAFYLPAQFQGNPPEPKEEDINLVDAPGATVYVKVFGGFGTGGSVLKEAADLRQDLIQDDLSFKDNAFAYAAYDGPQKLINRHNEVWITASDSDCAHSHKSGPEISASMIDAVQSAYATAQQFLSEMIHN